MACFTVPVAEAVITTVATKIIEKKELKEVENGSSEACKDHEVNHVRFSTKLKSLTKLLWGGSALLAFEHLWHGEITPFPPFITAMQNAEDTAEMLHEISTVGVTMAAIVTGFWAVMTFVLAKKESSAKSLETAEVVEK